jgi:hypothetical protein
MAAKLEHRGRDVGHTPVELAEEGDGGVEQLRAPWCTGAGARRGAEDDGGVRACRNGRPTMMLDGDEVDDDAAAHRDVDGRAAATTLSCAARTETSWEQPRSGRGDLRVRADARPELCVLETDVAGGAEAGTRRWRASLTRTGTRDRPEAGLGVGGRGRCAERGGDVPTRSTEEVQRCWERGKEGWRR